MLEVPCGPGIRREAPAQGRAVLQDGRRRLRELPWAGERLDQRAPSRRLANAETGPEEVVRHERNASAGRPGADVRPLPRWHAGDGRRSRADRGRTSAAELRVLCL